MKKFWLYYLVCLTAITFVSCSKSEPERHYIDEPAVVTLKGTDTVLRIADGILHAPGQLKGLSLGDCLMAYFSVNFDKQPVANQTQVRDLNYIKVERSPVRIISGTMQSEFNDSIKIAAMYSRPFDSILFFVFEHKEGAYEHEIICNTDSIETRVDGIDIPKLYIRTRKLVTTESSRKKSNFAFDMSAFVKKYVNSDTKEVNLYLQYRTGTKQGVDVYQKFKNYPLRWKP